jgi:hypothetical protein
MVQLEFPEARLFRAGKNLGFGRANNLAMREARGEYFLLLNSDAELRDDRLPELTRRMKEDPSIAVVGPLIRFPSGKVQWNARRFPSVRGLMIHNLWLHRLMTRSRAAELLLGPLWDHGKEREVDWVLGACMVVRREAFEETGGFDSSIFLYGEEVEWCHRIRERGWKIVFSPASQIVHRSGESTRQLVGDRGKVDQCLLAEDRLLLKWEGRAASFIAPAARIAGAVLRLFAFGLRSAVGRDDEYGRSVRNDCRFVLDHYRRRMLGRVAEVQGKV